MGTRNSNVVNWSSRRVFTTGEVARICKISEGSVVRSFDSGRVGGFRVPGSRVRRIPRDDLLRYMRDNDIDVSPLMVPNRIVVFTNLEGLTAQSIKRSQVTNREVAVIDCRSELEFMRRWASSTDSLGLLILQSPEGHDELLKVLTEDLTERAGLHVILGFDLKEDPAQYPRFDVVDLNDGLVSLQERMRELLDPENREG